MPDLIQAQQGQEQKLVFKTEDERQKALDAIPIEPPAGTSDMDSWRRQQDDLQDRIEAAAIDPNYSAAAQPAQAAPASQAPSSQPSGRQEPDSGGDWYKPSDWTFQQNGQTVTIGRDEIPDELRDKGIKNAKDLILGYVSNSRYSDTKNREHQASIADLQKQMQEMNSKIKGYEKQIEDFGNRPAQPNATAAVPLPSETEMTTIEKELDEINANIDKVQEEDPDEAIRMTRKAMRLSGQLQAMRDRIYQDRFRVMEEERTAHKQQAEKDRAMREREEALRREQEQAAEKKRNMANEIEKFTATADSKLQLSKSFAEVEKEYSDWAIDIAASHFNIQPKDVKAEHAEIAVSNFLNRTPSLITKLTDQGKLNRAPKDLRKYLIATELYFMRHGQELDPVTGTWKQHDWRLPDMETAYERWKRKKGLKYMEEVEAANKAEEELLRVMNPPNVAEMVPASQGPQGARDMSKMSMPQAESVMKDLEKRASLSGYGDLEEWIETLRRKNPGDENVTMYDKADESLMNFKPQQR
jgi:hypothetical protein